MTTIVVFVLSGLLGVVAFWGAMHHRAKHHGTVSGKIGPIVMFDRNLSDEEMNSWWDYMLGNAARPASPEPSYEVKSVPWDGTEEIGINIRPKR